MDDQKLFESELYNNLSPAWKFEVDCPNSKINSNNLLKLGKHGKYLQIVDHDVMLTVEIRNRWDDLIGKVMLSLNDFLEDGSHDLVDNNGKPLRENNIQSKLNVHLLDL